MFSVDTSNSSLLGVFFLYLALLSGEGGGNLLNCKVQHIVEKNKYIQHFLLFLSIFIFTFILNWYTPKSLRLTDSVTTHSANETLDDISSKYTYVLNSLKTSLIIYFVFLFSTKLTNETTIVFFGLMIVLFILFLFYRIELESNNINAQSVNKLYVSKEYLNQLTNSADTTLLYYLHNGLSLGYASAALNMGYGMFQYYKKQRKDHAKEWDMLKFIFGTRNCDGV